MNKPLSSKFQRKPKFVYNATPGLSAEKASSVYGAIAQENQTMKDELNSIVPMTDFQNRQLKMLKTGDVVIKMELVAQAKRQQ